MPSTLLERYQALRTENVNARKAKAEARDALAATAEAAGADLTGEQLAQFDALRAEIRELDTAREGLEARIAEAEDEQRRDDAAARAAAELGDTRRVPSAKVNEPELYRQEGEHSFFGDLFRSQVQGDRDAGERIARHNEAALEQRDVTVSTFGGLIPPQYLVDMFAPVARAGRPFLNALTSLPLPADGVSFTIPRVTTGSAADATTEGSGWNEQDMAETDLTFKAELVTAQQDISRTTFQRGGAVVDTVVFPDMIAAYHSKLDALAINGSGTSPQHRGLLNVSGINAVTYTDASPTVAELWPKLSDAIQRVNANRFLPATFILMHPTRWGWFKAAVDTAGRPLLGDQAEAPQNAIGVGTAAAYGQVVGTLQGLPVITDANIPTNLGGSTNEDRIIVVRGFDMLLWEENGGEPMSFTFEQTAGPEKVRLAVGGFSGYTAGRYPTAISVISGTGLATPSF